MGLGNRFLNKVALYNHQHYKCVDDLDVSVVMEEFADVKIERNYPVLPNETETLKESIIDLLCDNITNVHHFAENTVD